jgi:NAD(P)-dependent dehydrogenase (short-subunit alcohol dehydrogenase family)
MAGKTVVITGASAGLGRATARAFGRRGYRVGLIARGRERLETTRREILDFGGQAAWVAADVADAEAIDRAADDFEETLGPIDVWVNSAMVTVFSPITRMTPADFRRVVEVTLLGQVHGTMSALRRMRKRDRGTIVQVGSALAWRAIPLQSAYCAAKHGVRAFTDSLRSELLHDGSQIRLTMVQMPAINTPQFDWARSRMPRKLQPMPPIFQPEVPAEAIVRAAETTPRELWVGRSSIAAIIGSLFFPSYIDRLLANAGYSGQQAPEPADPQRPDNLYQPVPGPFEAHGRFDKQSQSRGVSVGQNTMERLMLGGVLALAASTVALGALQLRRRPALR